MEEERKKSKLLVILFWLAAIGCFIFGYYNSVLGLSTFKVFGSGYGSWVLALIPLVMVFGGYYASVQGKKGMLALYLLGESVFLVFNLTYLYPQYLGRTLVNEEANALGDSIEVYQGRLDNIVVHEPKVLQRLRQIQDNLMTEIKDRRGFGPEAKKELEKFNQLAGTVYTPTRQNASTKEGIEQLEDEWQRKTDAGIRDYIVRLNGSDQAAKNLVECKTQMDIIAATYTPKIEMILNDNSDVSIKHDDVANNPQILLLKQLTEKLDKVATNVNSIKQDESFNLIVTGDETIAFPKTQKLGTFEHTLISTWERINKLDTWGVIIVCLFFDMLGPFLFYFYLRRDDEEYRSDDGAFDRPRWWEFWK